MEAGLQSRLQQLLRRHAEIAALLAGGGLDSAEFAKLSREYSELDPIVAEVNALEAARTELVSLMEVAQTAEEPDLRGLAEEEARCLRERLPDLEQKIKLSLLPKDADDERNAILEVRAGTGGEEAALFAAELFRMYQRYAALHGWRFEVLDVSETGLGGFKEASASIAGSNVFARLKFESGVHRVQRVPETEAGGRIHTSAATVAVLPEAEEVDVRIDEKDLRIDVFRASGPGGQSVNTTDSAVRITHLPTGLVVVQQEEKSQHKNKAKALKVLRARLYERARRARESARAAERRSQVGSGDRSERIRTYNFPQGRVTDHRINLTLYKLDKVLSGEALDEIIDALLSEDQAARLAAAAAWAKRSRNCSTRPPRCSPPRDFPTPADRRGACWQPPSNSRRPGCWRSPRGCWRPARSRAAGRCWRAWRRVSRCPASSVGASSGVLNSPCPRRRSTRGRRARRSSRRCASGCRGTAGAVAFSILAPAADALCWRCSRSFRKRSASASISPRRRSGRRATTPARSGLPIAPCFSSGIGPRRWPADSMRSSPIRPISRPPPLPTCRPRLRATIRAGRLTAARTGLPHIGCSPPRCRRCCARAACSPARSGRGRPRPSRRSSRRAAWRSRPRCATLPASSA